MKLVFIHGRAQGGRERDEVKAEWLDALRAGFDAARIAWPDALDVSFPFYGARLDRLVELLESPLLVDILARGEPVDARAVALQGEMLAELAVAAAIPDSEIQSLSGAGPQERGVENSRWVHAIARALDRTPLGTSTISLITHDVSVYLTNRNIRRQIDAIVAEPLQAGPCVVVAHSLGSVVAYNVLCSRPAELDVRAFVTVGSPLGLQSVRKQLDAPLRMPPAVQGWFNARDPRDIVATRPLDATTFAIQPPIVGKSNVSNHTDNRHGIEGYLNDPDVARKIAAALV